MRELSLPPMLRGAVVQLQWLNNLRVMSLTSCLSDSLLHMCNMFNMLSNISGFILATPCAGAKVRSAEAAAAIPRRGHPPLALRAATSPSCHARPRTRQAAAANQRAARS